jgi:putative sterol carrier protein
MNKTERARKDIAGWKRSIQVKTAGGRFAIEIDNGSITIEEKVLDSPDFIMVCKDLETLLDGLAYRGALTDAIIMGKLWISKNMEFTTIFKLDRMARSLARTAKK